MSYTVSLASFSGPLDLLLHLVKQEEVEITEIPLRVICDRYLEHMKDLEALDVDVASEFLVMASTLMLIKSRALLPKEEEVDLDEELDPEDELIQQLLEYKRFKVATRDLEQLALDRARIFPYRAPRLPGEEPDVELEETDVWDLVRAFAALLKETGLDRAPRLIRAEKPLREYVEEVYSALREARTLRFRALFAGATERITIIGRFIALLELVRRQLVRFSQPNSFDEIELSLVADRDLSAEEMETIEDALAAPAATGDLDDDLADSPPPAALEEPDDPDGAAVEDDGSAAPAGV